MSQPRPEACTQSSSTTQISTSSTALNLEARMKYIGDCKILMLAAMLTHFNSIADFSDNFPYCDESSKYEKVAKIGQGTFG